MSSVVSTQKENLSPEEQKQRLNEIRRKVFTVFSEGINQACNIHSIVSNIRYSVATAIMVRNYTTWALEEPSTKISFGYCELSPSAINAGNVGVSAFRKKGFRAEGTSGTICWQIEDTEWELVLMWCVPFNQDFFINTLAVGVFQKGTHRRLKKKVFTEMYKSLENGSLNPARFKTAKFHVNIEDMKFTCNETGIGIIATMGTNHKPVIKVDVYPMKQENLHKYV